MVTSSGPDRTAVGRRLSESERRLIHQTFDAFAWRKKPARAFATWDYIADDKGGTPDELLAGIAPRDLTDEQVEAIFGVHNDLLHYTTPAGRLYYLPVVVSRCVRGDRDELLQDSIVWQFRHRPFGDVTALPQQIDTVIELERKGQSSFEGEPQWLVASVRNWLMMSAPGRRHAKTWHQTLDLVSAMTSAERDALVAFFDYRLTYSDSLRDPEIASAQALLAGHGVMEVLCIRTHSDCMAVVAVLEELAARHPVEFPPAEAAPLKNALLDIVAGRRSPHATLGW